MKKFLILLLCGALPLQGSSLRALYNSLDPQAVPEALAFYELYPGTEEADAALARVSSLLQIPSFQTISCLPTLINRLEGAAEQFTERDIRLVEYLASGLPNRRLDGYLVQSEEGVIDLSTDEIDLGKALILSQMQGEEDECFQARSYSAMLDLMALQILAKLPKNATPEQKIHETNRLIFDQMHFRFPPHSVYVENIDLYTFLPSVMDNHLGVCLGVTALYLAIAQRIDLPLEIITPPGHIYIRYRDENLLVNIETTARGVHFPNETYLSVNNAELEVRNLKEVIGMTHVNQASIYLYRGDFQKAADAYQKALPYMPDDPLVKELLGYSFLLTERIEEGKALLVGIESGIHHIAQDYLAGKVDLDGIRSVFLLVDETRDSILAKQAELQKIIKKYPEFRDGLHQLAVAWIQLNRAKEAIEALKAYHVIDPNDAVVEYYLAILHGQRHDYKSCWTYLRNAEQIALKDNFYPKALKDLRHLLILHCPE